MVLRPVYSARTDPGRRRTSNQDAVYAGYVVSGVPGAAAEPLLLLVADGVGGRERGQWASQTAVSVLVAALPAVGRQYSGRHAARS
jgi:protein phosphatase